MNTPLKKQTLARLCTGDLKNRLWGWVVEGGQDKGGGHEQGEHVDLGAKGRIEQALISLRAGFRHEELMGGRGDWQGCEIGKGSRKETGLWSGCIGKGVVQ